MKHVATLPPKDRSEAIARLLPVLELFAEGKPINVKVSVAKPDRTPWQNRYLFGVAYKLLSEATGYEVPDLHEYACIQHFGGKTRKAPGGRVIESPLRTTTTDEDGNPDLLDGDAFWQFVEFVQRLGARAGVVIPDPDPEKATNPRRSKWKRAA